MIVEKYRTHAKLKDREKVKSKSSKPLSTWFPSYLSHSKNEVNDNTVSIMTKTV